MLHVVLTRRPDAHDGRRPEAGFTLIELVMTIALLGVVLVALVAMMLTSLTVNRQSDGQLTEATDVQLVTSYFADDAQGAVTFDVGGTPECGSTVAGVDADDVVEFRGNSFDDTGAAQVTRVAYQLRTVTSGALTTRELRRVACTGSDPGHLAHGQETVLARQLLQASGPTVTCRSAAGATACSAPAAVSVQVVLQETSGLTYTLLGTRRTP